MRFKRISCLFQPLCSLGATKHQILKNTQNWSVSPAQLARKKDPVSATISAKQHLGVDPAHNLIVSWLACEDLLLCFLRWGGWWVGGKLVQSFSAVCFFFLRYADAVSNSRRQTSCTTEREQGGETQTGHLRGGLWWRYKATSWPPSVRMAWFWRLSV